jgi:hypothetical protein
MSTLRGKQEKGNEVFASYGGSPPSFRGRRQADSTFAEVLRVSFWKSIQPNTPEKRWDVQVGTPTNQNSATIFHWMTEMNYPRL